MTSFDSLPIEEQLVKNRLLLETVSRTLSQFIAEVNPFILLNGLLDDLLVLTESEYGFIGEVLYDAHGQPFIQSYATTDISWSKETRLLYEETSAKGMAFSKLDSLYGEVLKTGKYLISNNPASDPRSGGLPVGHPPLDAFLGIPFYSSDNLQGVVGIANRQHGYDESLIEYLSPFVAVCGDLIHAYRNNCKTLQLENDLKSYKRRVSALSKRRIENNLDDISTSPQLFSIDEGNFHDTNKKQTIELTKKEALLLKLLISHSNQVLEYPVIEAELWKNVVVSESTLRALVLRLRKKVPSVNIKTVTGVGYILTKD